MDDVRLARAYLLRVAEPPAGPVDALIRVLGPVGAAEAVRAGEVPETVKDATSARRRIDRAEQDLAEAAAVGARLVVPEDDEWPQWPLLSLTNALERGHRWAAPPIGLWVRGPARLDDSLQRAVAVVGARAATSYGEHVATEFGYGLAQAGVTVVSGAAFGVDGAAHRGALAGHGTTVAVLACGVDEFYPAAHSALLRRIAGGGAVVSEYPPGTTPAKHRFLVRNRLIAALASGTVVVEAGIRSGARNTASTTVQLGKTLVAVPGPVTSVMSQGCHELLRGGSAVLASSVPEVLEAVGTVGEFARKPPAPSRPTDVLGDTALRVHDALPRRGSVDLLRIAADSGVPVDKAATVLSELELLGFAEPRGDGWRRGPAGEVPPDPAPPVDGCGPEAG